MNSLYDGPSRVAWRIVGSEVMISGVICSAWQPTGCDAFQNVSSFGGSPLRVRLAFHVLYNVMSHSSST